VRSILEANDYLVTEAFDCEQVFAMVLTFGPDLVILALQMPKLDGYATVVALRRMPALQRTPIIALTAAITQTVPEKISEAGFTEYLVKPIGPPSCASAQQRYCRKRESGREIVTPHLVSKSVTADAEAPCCLRLVACRFTKRFLDYPSFLIREMRYNAR
jgi:CheY-like chemotaxis protein